MQGLSQLKEQLLAATAAETLELLGGLTEQQQAAILYSWDFWARPDQRVPKALEDERSRDTRWVIRCGRGWGKTRVGAETVNYWAEKDPGIRIALVGANPADVRKVMVDGESGILESSPPWFRPTYNPSLLQLTWPNGSTGHIYSGEKPSGLRGPQHHRYWIDEFAKFRFPTETWQQLIAGMRLGNKPRGLITTTPRPIPIIKQLLARRGTIVTSGSTFDNTVLPQSFFDELIAAYKGTALERQELYGEILDQVEGALWNWDLLHSLRVNLNPETLEPEIPTDIVRVVMSIDPAVTTTETSDETGATVIGLGADGNGYLLADLSAHGGLDRHAVRLVEQGIEMGVDLYVGETNNGGDLVEHTLRQVIIDGKNVGRNLPFKKVTASRGKRTRAEPVGMLYQQKKVKHVGTFADLESQMCTWNPTDPSAKSPDRVDALVWGLTELMVAPGPRPRIRSLRS